MKQIIKCLCLTLPKKLRVDLRLIIDDRNNTEFISMREDIKNISVNFYPTIGVSIIRPREIDENGKFQSAPWNPDDNLGMTKYNFPTFVNELKGIQKDLRIPKLYTYQGKRLELNEAEAEKIRRVFMIGNMTIELSAVVITKADTDGTDMRIEGIKMKFNNERSSVLLTLNDLDSLVYNLDHLDIDSLAMLMYLNYATKPNHPMNFDTAGREAPKPNVDIQPLKKTFASPEDDIEIPT